MCPTTDPSFVLLDDGLSVSGASSRLYVKLLERIECATPEDLAGCFTRLDHALNNGGFVIGLFGYELGFALEPRSLCDANLPVASAPLFTLLVFAQCNFLRHEEVDAWVDRAIRERRKDHRPSGIARLREGIDRQEYIRRIARIHEYIRAGDTYQVNFTFPLFFDTFGDPFALYAALRRRQRVEYGAFISLPERSVLSFSPELFLKREGTRFVTKPMKGTSRRGAMPEEDAARAALLREEPKTRAENVMIVDLLRNDLGRIARPGSVHVRSLFDIETYPTLLQMTSTVEASIDPLTTLHDIFRALFPCGSVTSAPKIRTMQIIRELENSPRGLYTGAIGYIDPNRDFTFNVAIRTIVINADTRGQMGVGSGIVADSDAQAEWEECLLKARFMVELDPGFALLETLSCRPVANATHAPLRLSIRYLNAHLARLIASARYFGFACRPTRLRTQLAKALVNLAENTSYRLRLTLTKNGVVEIGAEPIGEDMPASANRNTVPGVRLSQTAIDADDLFCRHKTTYRPVYDGALKQAQAAGCWDEIFLNRRGELAEGARSNVFLQIDGRLVTPHVSSGALPGVMRAMILADPGYAASERVLTLDDLRRADRIWLTNAVRGMLEVKLVGVS